MTGNLGATPETILLVEHCQAVSQTVTATLERAKFSVLHAESGSSAVEMAATHKGIIHLLLADVNIPGMLGSEIAEAVRLAQPNIRVIFMSEMGNGGLLMLNHGWAFVNMPFVPESLLQLISIVLRASTESRGARLAEHEAVGHKYKRTASKSPKLLTMTANPSAGE